LTLYSFSSENWRRPPEEIDDLMGLMKRYIRGDLADLHQSNVRIRIIGERTRVEGEMMALIDEAQELTKRNTGLTLIIAFNYGSRAEITRAARRLAEQVADGQLPPEQVTPERLAGELDTADTPDPDLLIRTAGEMRISNFLLWQISYAEFYATDALWPDFSKDDLNEAIRAFAARDRRFGGVKNDVPAPNT
jgi:undecaprenyl diphosphate synthase